MRIFYFVILKLTRDSLYKLRRCYPHSEPFNITTKEPLPYITGKKMLLGLMLKNATKLRSLLPDLE
jgi:hypothetical protein